MAREETQRAYDVLNKFLKSDNHRKTPERYAVLDAIYSMDSLFTMDALNEALNEKRFRVSMATLYNHLQDAIVYEAAFSAQGYVRLICRMCGRVTEQKNLELEKTIGEMKISRFRKDNFTLYLYGVCGKCQSKKIR